MDLLLPAALLAFLVPITVIDLDRRIIPNRLTGAAAAVALVLVALVDPSSAPERLAAAGLAGGAFLAVALASPAGMGMGDVKLVAVLGLYLGATVAVAVVVALAAGTVAGLAIVVRRGRARRAPGDHAVRPVPRARGRRGGLRLPRAARPRHARDLSAHDLCVET